MSNYNRGGSDISWALIIAAFVLFWPVGVFLLIAKLNEEGQGGARQDWEAAMRKVREGTAHMGEELQRGMDDWERRSHQASGGDFRPHSYTRHSASERRGETVLSSDPGPSVPAGQSGKPRYNGTKGGKGTRKPKIRGGKGLLIAGIVLAALFGFAGVSTFVDWLGVGLFAAVRETLPLFILTGFGGGMALWGGFKNKKARRFRKLMNMIGESKQVDIQALAEAVPCSYNRACDTLQDMIDEGLLGERAYIDMGTGFLMMDGKGLGDRKPRKAKAKSAEPKQSGESEEMKILSEIRRVNDEIPDPELSRKIDRIEEITRHILDYQKKHPEKAAELHKFLNYYLPTTLKILNSYAELDRQGVDGSNISTTKERIERMMDRIVEGFETQLDKLFEGDMLDISSDISVMERMLSRDGLSGGMRMPRAGEAATPQLTLEPEKAAEPQSASAAVTEPTTVPESVPAAGRTAPVTEPTTVPESVPAAGWTEPVTEPMTMPQSTSAAGWTAPVTEPTPDPFTTPEGIHLTLTPEQDAQPEAAQSWENGFYRRTKEELDNQ